MLFLCTGNSARSIIAEAIVNREGRGRFRAWSAGSMPKGEVNPQALEPAAQPRTIRPRDCARSRGTSSPAPDAPKLDFVFTVCDNAAAEVCPIWPGQPMTAHWGMPDPAAATGSPAEIGAGLRRHLPDAATTASACS